MQKKMLFDAASPLPPLILEEALLAMDGNPELLMRVAGLLLKQLDADLPLIRQYVQANESLALKDRSHRLKGSLSAIAATPAFIACKALNELAVEAHTQRFSDGLACLESEVLRLRPHLTQLISTLKT